MKKTNILIFGVLIVTSFFMSSYRSGAANNGWDCTGAESGLSNPTGCSNGGCHGNSAITGITVTLELDSAGIVPIIKYKPDSTYTVKITGTNTTTFNLPKFGFQVACILGSTGQVTPTNAGTFQQTGLPSGVHFSAPQANNYVTNIIEHTLALAPLSGTGGNGTIYQKSFKWTAPAAGTGTVSFWGVLNAVNGDGSASSADKWNTQNLIVEEDTAKPIVNGITEVNSKLELNLYPNPATDLVHLEVQNGTAGVYNLNVFTTEGRTVLSQTAEVTAGTSNIALDISRLEAGIYFINLAKGSESNVIKVVKK